MISGLLFLAAAGLVAGAELGRTSTARRRLTGRLAGRPGRRRRRLPSASLHLPKLVRAAGALLAAWLLMQGLMLTGLMVATATLAGPRLVRAWRGRSLDSSLRDDLPGVLELLAHGLEAGASLETVMEALAEGYPGALGEELRAFLSHRRLGATRAEALSRLAQRSRSQDWRLVLAALLEAEEMGTPTARVLGGLAPSLHQRRLARVKAQAARLGPQIALAAVFLSAPSAFALLAGSALLGGLGQVPVLGWLRP